MEELAVYQANISIYDKLLACETVKNKVSKVDYEIIKAAAGEKIGQMSNEKFVAIATQMLRFIALDVSYKISDNQGEWAYIQARLLDVMRKYYSDLTLSEIKQAFELSAVGELDDFLPLDRYGNADKKHYGAFNADYFARIVNAYKKRKGLALEAGVNNMPQSYSDNISDSDRDKEVLDSVFKTCFLRYKYRNELPGSEIEYMLIYERLKDSYIVNNIELSDNDKKSAYLRYLKRASMGIINKYTAGKELKKGDESTEIQYIAYEIARKKEIKDIFDYIIDNDLNINLL